MAKKEQKRTEEQLPEGYSPVNAAAGGAWFKPELGDVVHGEILGRFRRKKSLNGQEAWFYQIMVEHAMRAVRKVDDETIEVDLSPGEIVNMDEKSALEDLAGLLDSGKRWRIYVKPLNKVPVPGTTRTVWRFTIGKQEIVPGKNEPKVKPVNADGVPF